MLGMVLKTRVSHYPLDYQCTHVNKLFILVCVFCLHCPCSVVVGYILLYSLFLYTDVVTFLFIRWSSKQVHCFIFGPFVYHYKQHHFYFRNSMFVFWSSLLAPFDCFCGDIWSLSCGQANLNSKHWNTTVDIVDEGNIYMKYA